MKWEIIAFKLSETASKITYGLTPSLCEGKYKCPQFILKWVGRHLNGEIGNWFCEIDSTEIEDKCKIVSPDGDVYFVKRPGRKSKVQKALLNLQNNKA